VESEETGGKIPDQGTRTRSGIFSLDEFAKQDEVSHNCSEAEV
jgi:hypothetical protein